jgi:hypothetical protein
MQCLHFGLREMSLMRGPRDHVLTLLYRWMVMVILTGSLLWDLMFYIHSTNARLTR